MRKRIVCILLGAALLLAVIPVLAAGADTGFSDVNKGDWYADAVQYVQANDLMEGTGKKFEPEGTMTRAMLATVLYRVEGSPTVTGEDAFSDTDPDTWYTDGVLWASQQRLVEGYGNGKFGTNDPVTREQLATILWRYDGSPAAEEPSETFEDADGISEYAVEAVRWAKANNVIHGKGGNRFDPKGNATRAEVATVLMNYETAAASEDEPKPTDTAQPAPGGTTPATPGNPGGGTPEMPADPDPDTLREIPSAYFSAASQKGTLEDLYYDTWESFSYAEKTRKLTKHAVVYLPYGYSDQEQYDVFYLSHGGWSNENTTLGTPANPNRFKNVLDHAIENGEIRPLIVVCPTYNNTSESDSGSFSLALQLTRNFHNELINDLVPAVEKKYSTYAETTDLPGLAASRDHRGFGGFSMGSVNTWRTFQYGLDYFKYFLPFSCGTSLDDEEIWSAAQGRDQSDYALWMMTGTSDFAYSYDNARAERAKTSGYFTDGVNFAYTVKEGYSHDGNAANEYTYNGLMKFFGPEKAPSEPFTADTKLTDITNAPAFEGFGRLLLPASNYTGTTLDDLSITWYGHPDTAESVAVVNTLKAQAESGQKIFYDIYTAEEKAADPTKRDTGLFFFKGKPGAKFAVCNAGGGWVFVGTMQDSFPHALELSKLGYNAFAVIYRPGVPTAYEDLGAALRFIFDHAEELEVDTSGYSLWGGSAGARMAATLGNADYLRQYTDRTDTPQAAAVIMQYTGYSETSRSDAPAYVCVGTSDSIASWRTMQSRVETLSSYGIPTEFHAYEGLPHGFGLGIGTKAEGWINDAIAFWQAQIKSQKEPQ